MKIPSSGIFWLICWWVLVGLVMLKKLRSVSWRVYYLTAVYFRSHCMRRWYIYIFSWILLKHKIMFAYLTEENFSLLIEMVDVSNQWPLVMVSMLLVNSLKLLLCYFGFGCYLWNYYMIYSWWFFMSHLILASWFHWLIVWLRK